MRNGIYLDNSSTTHPSLQAVHKMTPFLTEMWGSPSSPHQKGQEVFPALAESLRSIYTLIGAEENDDFVFTSSGTEAVNQVIMSTYDQVTRTTGKNQYITSVIDEAPALMTIGHLEEFGCVGKLVNPEKTGQISPNAIAEAMSPRTALVSLSWANGLTGVINPVEEIAKICRERGVLLHLDATHVLGKLFYDLKEIGAHFITFNGDHLHAPKGTGGLWIKSGVKCGPLIWGGHEQAGKRAGSFNVPGLIALGQAALEAQENQNFLCTEIARLRDKLEEGICSIAPNSVVFFQDQERLPHCTTIAFPGIANEALLYALNRKGVFASIGGGNFQQIGLILAATGIDTTLANSAIHFSLSHETKEAEIDRVIQLVAEAIKPLQKMSVQLMSTET